MKRIVLIILLSFAAIPVFASPEEAAALNTRGMEELGRNNPAAAKFFFLKAISADPSKRHFYNNLSCACIRLGEYSIAEEYLHRALKFDENYAKALSGMAVVLFRQGRYRESYVYYIKSLRADGEFTRQRFDRQRITIGIKELSRSKPEDSTLKRIIEYIDTKNEQIPGE